MPAGVTVVVKFNHCPKIAAALRPRALQIVTKTAQDIANSAKANTIRVDTGGMKNGFQIDPRGPMTRVVFNTQHYFAYHELGTVNISPAPMLTPVAKAATAPFRAAFKQLLSGIG